MLQANETQQWETLAEILMDACLANPAASIDLHEVLYGVVTPAGQWRFWGQGALRKLVAPISSIAGFSMQAFRNNQPRDSKHSSSRSLPSSHSDPDDFSIGTCRSDIDDQLPQTSTSAVSNHPLSLSAATQNSSDNDEPAVATPAFTQQTLPEGDQTQANSSREPMAAFSDASEQIAASSSTTDSAGSSAVVQQPSGSSALTLQSGSPNTVAQAAASPGGSGNKKRPPLKSAPRLASSEAANLPGEQASIADGTTTADLSAASSTMAGKAKPDPKSEQVPPLTCRHPPAHASYLLGNTFVAPFASSCQYVI